MAANECGATCYQDGHRRGWRDRLVPVWAWWWGWENGWVAINHLHLLCAVITPQALLTLVAALLLPVSQGRCHRRRNNMGWPLVRALTRELGQAS